MRMQTARDLGALLRERRLLFGWTQQELADRCGASKRWIVGVEAGKPGAEVGLVLRAIAALDQEVSVRSRPHATADELASFLEEIDRTEP